MHQRRVDNTAELTPCTLLFSWRTGFSDWLMSSSYSIPRGMVSGMSMACFKLIGELWKLDYEVRKGVSIPDQVLGLMT